MFRKQLSILAVCILTPMMAHAKDVGELIPSDTYGYLVVHRLADTDKKMQALGNRMNLPIPSLLSMAKMQFHITEGVDQSGSIAVALLPSEQGPVGVLYVPVDDYDAFIQQLKPDGTKNGITQGSLKGGVVIVGKKSGHAVVTKSHNRDLLKKILSNQGEDPTDPNRLIRVDEVFDLAAVLSSSGVKLLAEQGQKGLEEAKVVMQAQLGEDNPALAGIEVYVHILKVISSEVSAVSCGLKLEESGSIRVNEKVYLQPSGHVAPLLEGFQKYDGDLLSTLPNIPYVFAMGGVIPERSIEPLMDFSGDLMKSMRQLYGLTPEQVDQMMELSLKYFPDMRGMSFLMGAGRDNAPLYSEMLGALYVRDAKNYIANYRKFWSDMDDVIAKADDSFLKEVQLKDIQLNGTPVLKVSMPIPGLQGISFPQGELDEMMKKLYGTDGITVFLAAADDDTVLIAYTDTVLLSKVLQASPNKAAQISQNPHVAKTSKRLPTGGQMVGYWSPNGTIAFANRAIRLFDGAESGFRLPDFPETQPVGWMMNATTSAIEFNTVVPVETIESVGRFVEKLNEDHETNAAEQPALE